MRKLHTLCGGVLLAGAGCGGLLLGLATDGSGAPPRVLTFIAPIPKPVPITPRTVPVFRLPIPVPSGPPTPTVQAGEVLFESTRDGAPEIYQMDGTGVGQTRLTSAFGGVRDPTYSSSGRLTYATAVNGHWEIVAGSNQLTHDGSSNRQPRWVIGNTLVYVSNRSGNDDLWLSTAPTDPPVDITGDSTAPDIDPAPSADGKRVAFASQRGAGFDIYVLTLATRTTVQLTHDGAGNRHPSWSPDGSRIAFDRAGDGGSDIWTMASDGSGARAVIATAADEYEPAYAPALVANNARFAYVTNANGNYEIWAANDDGREAFDLSQSPAGDDISPFWAQVPQGFVLELLLQPNEVVGAGGGPNSDPQCTIVFTGKEPIVGTARDDVICGSNGADVIRAKGGNDVIYPRGGNDIVSAGVGTDLVYARGGGRDTVFGRDGYDVAYVDPSDVSEPDVEQTLP